MATAQLNTRTVTETQMVDWATASAEVSKAAGDAPYDIILKATKDAIVRAGHEVSDAHMRVMRHYMSWNCMSYSPAVVTMLFCSQELAKWALLPAGSAIPLEIADAIREQQANGAKSHVRAVVEYMEALKLMGPLKQATVVDTLRGYNFKDEVELLDYVATNHPVM